MLFSFSCCWFRSLSVGAKEQGFLLPRVVKSTPWLFVVFVSLSSVLDLSHLLRLVASLVDLTSLVAFLRPSSRSEVR